MKYKEEEMRSFGRLIGELVAGQDMAREVCKEAYRQVILNKQPELQQGAFLAAHLAKKATLDELCGVWDALYEYDTATISPNFPEDCCDIVGTGSDALKTINVSTPASFLAAACGVKVAKKRGTSCYRSVRGHGYFRNNGTLYCCAPYQGPEMS